MSGDWPPPRALELGLGGETTGVSCPCEPAAETAAGTTSALASAASARTPRPRSGLRLICESPLSTVSGTDGMPMPLKRSDRSEGVHHPATRKGRLDAAPSE